MHFNLQCFQKCQGRYPNSPSIQLLRLGRSSFRPAWKPALVAPFTRSPSQFTAGQIQNLMREDLFLESQCRRLLLLHPLQQQAKDGRAENVVSLVVTVCLMFFFFVLDTFSIKNWFPPRWWTLWCFGIFILSQLHYMIDLAKWAHLKSSGKIKYL